MTKWANADGLTVMFGTFEGEPLSGQGGKVSVGGGVEQIVLDFDYTTLPAFNADLNNDGTNDGFIDGLTAKIPANSYITRATLVVTTAFTSAGATTLDIGLAQLNGTVIDLDGIDAVIAKTAIDAVGETVLCNGALVGGTASVGTADAYVYTTVTTGPYTAGAAKLIIEYIPTQV